MRLARSLLLSAVLLPASSAGAQSLLDRSPNVSGDWTGAPGTIYFNFVHRFTRSDAPERKVSNIPSFLLAAGLPARLLVGLNYSTNSSLVARFPNEYELLARWAPLSQDHGAPFDLGGQVDYNTAAQGTDAELSVARRLGFTRVTVAGRALSKLEESGMQYAIAGGAALRLNTYLALAGDYATVQDRPAGQKPAWSAGVHFAIPLTPHTVSLHATNTTITTLQGASRGTNEVRYGFEFTIPLTLRRYFGRRAETTVAAEPEMVDTMARADTTRAAVPTDTARVPAQPDTTRPVPVAPSDTTRARPVERDTVAARPAGAAPARPAPARPPQRTVRNGMKNMNYLQGRLVVRVGTTVEWTNNDPLPHTVTASDKSFDSGLIQPGKSYRHTFTKAGTFNYFCVPHPFMKGVVVVEAQ